MGLAREESGKLTVQLYQDLQATYARLDQYGWVDSMLIAFLDDDGVAFIRDEDNNWPPDDVIIDHAGPCCVTGAAGIAIDGMPFIRHVIDTATCDGARWDWSERGEAVLQALATYVPPDLESEAEDADGPAVMRWINRIV